MCLNRTEEARCPRLALSHGSNGLPIRLQKGKGQKQESSWKSESKTSETSGGKGWKKSDTQSKVGERATSLQATRPSGCYICDGPHQARDCPRKEKFNAIIAKEGENRGSKVPMRANPLQLLNAIQAEATH